jgi:hypothetical protein
MGKFVGTRSRELITKTGHASYALRPLLSKILVPAYGRFGAYAILVQGLVRIASSMTCLALPCISSKKSAGDHTTAQPSSIPIQQDSSNVSAKGLSTSTNPSHLFFLRDGTLVTQRFHFAPMPHKYRHVLGWYRLIQELREHGIRAICVFDGEERTIAKSSEVCVFPLASFFLHY